MRVGDKAAMSNCKPLSFQVVRPKFSRVCYDLITHSQSESGLKSAKAYDISSQESPLMKCIRRNLLFPKRYFNRNYSKRSKKLSQSSGGTKLLKHSNEPSKVNAKWENFHRMKEAFQPKTSREDMIKKSLNVISKAVASLDEIKSKREKLKNQDAQNHQVTNSILDEMEPWIQRNSTPTNFVPVTIDN